MPKINLIKFGRDISEACSLHPDFGNADRATPLPISQPDLSGLDAAIASHAAKQSEIASLALAAKELAAIAGMGSQAATIIAFPPRKKISAPKGDKRGKAGSGKRANVKRALLSANMAGDAATIDKIVASCGSSLASVKSIRSDMLAAMRAWRDHLSPSFSAIVGGEPAKGSLACLNSCLIRGIEGKAEIVAEMADCGFSGFALSDGFIGPSISASLESMMILREFSAFSDQERQFA